MVPLLRLLWGYLSQLKVLLIKNWKLSYRNWKTTAAQLLAPVVFLLLLLVIQHVPAANKEDKAPKPQNVQHIPLCQGRHKGDTDCYPLFYYPTNNTKVNSIMNILAEKNNLSISFDLKDKQHIIGWSNSTSLYQYLKNNPNKTLAAVDWDIHTDGSGVEQVKFNLLYNSSCPSLLTSCVDWRPVMWRALGEALAVQYHGNKDTNWTLAQSTYPILNPPSDAVKTYGILFFYCGSMFFFIILLYQITYEKENKLRLGMRTMGLKGSMYWLSWFITAQILNFLSCLLLIAVGNACDFQFFRNTSFAVLLVIFFVFQLTMSLMAFFCSTFLPTTKLAIYISMMLFIIGVLLTLILSVFGSFVFMELYTGGDVATTFRWILTCLPMYNFAKAVFDVNNMSFSLGAITGQGYTWSDLYKKGALGENELIPPTIDSIYANLVLCCAFIVFSWYLDNVVGGHGVREPFYFLFTPRYWGLQRKPRMPPGTELQKSMSVSGDDEFFNNDRQYKQKQKADGYQSVIGSPDDFGENLSGLQAINLQKYYSSMFGLRKFHALRGFNANISEGNIFCLLGHNGAGKTTTVSILTGLLDATGGEGWIFGYNVNAEMDKIRAIMGVCPQHDILWDGLTAAEHLQLFAELKQVPRTQIRTEVAEKLDSVGLLSVANNQVSGFSGGMKRRLSVAMSCIGNPKIIFLDEPTTGMDPVSRRHVWNLIQELKKDRVVVLTTHSMEEADVLGDIIAIMSHGTIRCMGTSLFLKNRYGEGYRINITARTTETILDAQHMLAEGLPGCKLIAQTGEYLVYGLPHTALDHIVPFFKQVETEMQNDSKTCPIRDINISHTTLEEVFLKITRQAKEEEFGGKIPITFDD